jgi:RNA polymerase primary sigma factor
MKTRRPAPERSRFGDLDSSQIEVLGSTVERAMLMELADCKRKLAQAIEDIEGSGTARAGDDPQALAHHLAHGIACNGPEHARLGAVQRRYCALRSRLALANTKLVAHVAKRFRDRGIPYSDLLQEGFCGLLEAIDRFDLTHQTKLSTYATWWIRQAMQRAVAAGAYPVRLTPRHLRQLAQVQEPKERMEAAGDGAPNEPDEDGPGIIPFIHAATRPAVSLDATRDMSASFNLLRTISDPDGDATARVDASEAVSHLMEALRPSEQKVLSLRFGLGGRERLSLTQVGRSLDVSKERVRQIEERALEKLKARAEQEHLDEEVSLIDSDRPFLPRRTTRGKSPTSAAPCIPASPPQGASRHRRI